MQIISIYMKAMSRTLKESRRTANHEEAAS